MGAMHREGWVNNVATFEGRWRCEQCGEEVRGRETKCTSCGASRPEHVRFFLPKDAQPITDQRLLDRFSHGPDWSCAYCKADNQGNLDTCASCGASRAEGKQRETKRYREGEVPSSAEPTTPPSPQLPPAAVHRDPVPQQSFYDSPVFHRGNHANCRTKSRYVPPYGIALGVALTLCIAWIICLAFATREIPAVITALSWERSVVIEAERTVREEDWSIPSGGRKVSERQAIRSYVQVLDHYETRTRQISVQVPYQDIVFDTVTVDNGNGSFSTQRVPRQVTNYRTEYQTESYQEPVYREDPVYDTKYTYDIERWFVIRTPQSAGNSKECRWPTYVLGTRERVGTQTQKYLLHIRSAEEKPRQWVVEKSETEWRSFDQGEQIVITVNSLGTLTKIARAQAESISN